MPATSNATANMSRRQSFNGKGLTFVEMIFKFIEVLLIVIITLLSPNFSSILSL